jgi:ADP-heptose:LPS heptosyltransferase
MRQVAETLAEGARVVQLGAASDPLLPKVIDRRGEHSFRKVASILANASLFVGMEGFLTHLARAVGCRSVVVYGGYTKPDETGYPCNENLAVDLPCSPCWEPSGCHFQRKCLDAVSVQDVLAAVERALCKRQDSLETLTVDLPSDQ